MKSAPSASPIILKNSIEIFIGKYYTTSQRCFQYAARSFLSFLHTGTIFFSFIWHVIKKTVPKRRGSFRCFPHFALDATQKNFHAHTGVVQRGGRFRRLWQEKRPNPANCTCTYRKSFFRKGDCVNNAVGNSGKRRRPRNRRRLRGLRFFHPKTVQTPLLRLQPVLYQILSSLLMKPQGIKIVCPRFLS
jgi:hypothetical protein